MPYKDKTKRNEYSRQWVAERRLAFFHDKNCATCGATDQLELDHIDPASKVSHKIWSWREERRETELAKCQVLCRNCHEIKTCIENDLTLDRHGIKGYVRRNCRCDICRAANAKKRREQRARRKLSNPL